MDTIVNKISEAIFGLPLVIISLFTGLYFTIKTRGLQFRYLKSMPKLMFKSSESKVGTSSFQALAITLSGHVGTGNIAGVATAIFFGGPGAIFWMWIMALLGSASSFIESVLAQVYKSKINDEYRGGPAYYIEKGIGSKKFAIIFAFITAISLGIILPGVQSNTITIAIHNLTSVNVLIIGIIFSLLIAIIIFGGVKRIAHFAELIVPIMGIAYLFISLVIIIVNISLLDDVIRLIFTSAFSSKSIFGGISGSAVIWGVKRGLFSNEAGLGTTPNVAASAEVSHPVKQGLVQSFSVYIDTLLVCSATAFVILITGMYNVSADESSLFNLLYNGVGEGVEPGTIFTTLAVSTVFARFGELFVTVSLFFFVFTTIIAYYYQAETNLIYVFEKNKNHHLYKNLLRFSILGSIIFFSTKKVSVTWDFADIGIALIAWLNIIAILFLRKPALDTLSDFEKQLKAGKDPKYKCPKNVKSTVWK